MTPEQFEEMDAETVDWDLALRKLESDLESDAVERHRKD